MQHALAFVEDALSILEKSLHDRFAELRNIQLATVSPEGRPGLRTVILRGFERSPARAEIHSDARAAKTREIAFAGHVALLAWSPAERLQLRFEGLARLHHADDLARSRWDELSPNARKPYGLTAHPGRPIVSPESPTHLPDEARFEQFTVIAVELSSVDVLRLEDDGGQIRAFARVTPDGFKAAWIGP